VDEDDLPQRSINFFLLSIDCQSGILCLLQFFAESTMVIN